MTRGLARAAAFVWGVQGLFGAAPVAKSVVNAASYAASGMAPGSLAALFGSDLSTTTAAAAGYPLPSNFGGASVYVNGVAAPVLFISPEQINFQVPWETPTGPGSVVLISADGTSNQLAVQITAVAPGLFEGAVLSPAWGQAVTGSRLGLTSRAARAGEYIRILATGLGAVSNQPDSGAAPSETALSSLKTSASVTIGGIRSAIGFAGLAPPGPNPYTAGVYEIDALVPANVPAGDAVQVVVSVSGVASNAATISVVDGRSDSVAKFIELGASGAVILRAITSEDSCPTAALDGTTKLMQTRATATLPFYPVLSCEMAIPANTKALSVEGQALLLPTANLQRITVLGDSGCRMDASASQACYNAQAWPVASIAKNAIASNPQLLIHNGDYHYREVQCMRTVSGCAGSPWGYNWDVWREDLFKPFHDLLAAAPWIFVRGNHESCDRAGEGWFRFLDPRALPAACQVYTDPYSINAGQVHFIHLDSAQADDATAFPDQVAAYATQFDMLRQMVGSQAWIVTHRPLWGIRSNLNANVVLQAASNNDLPSAVQLILSGHTHTFQTYTFSPARAPQLVIGNSGDNLAAALTQPVVGALVGNATVTSSTVSGGFGFSTMTPLDNGGWTVIARDSTGAALVTCTFQPLAINCDR